MPNAHGLHRVTHHGPVMFLVLSGSSNLEGLQALLRSMQTCRAAWVAQRGDQRPWAILADLRNWEGITPDALAFGQEIQDWAAGEGMTRLARVFSAPVLASMVDRNLVDTPDSDMAQASFPHLTPALAWLRSAGIDCDAVEHACLPAQAER